jgi:hypothetical protein
LFQQTWQSNITNIPIDPRTPDNKAGAKEHAAGFMEALDINAKKNKNISSLAIPPHQLQILQNLSSHLYILLLK